VVVRVKDLEKDLEWVSEQEMVQELMMRGLMMRGLMVWK
jgi:hypothetical protein